MIKTHAVYVYGLRGFTSLQDLCELTDNGVYICFLCLFLQSRNICNHSFVEDSVVFVLFCFNLEGSFAFIFNVKVIVKKGFHCDISHVYVIALFYLPTHSLPLSSSIRVPLILSCQVY